MKEDFTNYDIKPKEFLNYLRYYGEHFNKKLYKFACKQLANLQYTKDSLETLLKDHNVEIKNGTIWDILYITNWYNNLLYNSGTLNEQEIVVFLRNIFDKESDLLFNRWYADMAKQGIAIEWEDMV